MQPSKPDFSVNRSRDGRNQYCYVSHAGRNKTGNSDRRIDQAVLVSDEAWFFGLIGAFAARLLCRVLAICNPDHAPGNRTIAELSGFAYHLTGAVGGETQGVGQFDYNRDGARFGWREAVKFGEKRPHRLNEVAWAPLQFGAVGRQCGAAIDGCPIEPAWAGPLVKSPERLYRPLDRGMRMLARRIG